MPKFQCKTSCALGFTNMPSICSFLSLAFLVTHSAYRRQGDMWGFATARALRIFPALVVCALAVPMLLIVTGAWVDGTPQQILNYAARMISLVFIEFSRPNVFADLPFAHAINGSIWSLRHEVGAYALLTVYVATGVFFTSNLMLLTYTAVVISISMVGHILFPNVAGGVWFLVAETRFVIVSFLLGVLTHRLAAWIWIDWKVAVALCLLITVGQAFVSHNVAVYGFIVVMGYCLLCLAYAGAGQTVCPLT